MQHSIRTYICALALLFWASACQNGFQQTEKRDEDGRVERFKVDKKDGLKHGPYERFHPNGTIAEQSNYVKGQLNGERKMFYPNGVTEIIENYRNGVIDGKYQRFFENGVLYVEQYFVNGVMEGLSLRYYKNGVLEEKVTMKNNEEDGPFTEYYENGNLKTEGTYAPQEDGPVEHGELKEYDINGQLIRIADCKMGACRTRWKKE